MRDDYIITIMQKLNEDQESLKVITRLEKRINLEQTNVNGSRTTIVHGGYGSGNLYAIERFVKDVIKGSWRSEVIEECKRYNMTPKFHKLYLLENYYHLANSWLRHYSDIYRYSARVEAFYEVCKSMGLIDHQAAFIFCSLEEIECGNGVRDLDFFNTLIEQVYARCNTREFKERERLRKMNAERNKQNVLALEEAMFSKETGRSRWLILSLTLRYKPTYRRSITPEIIQQHRDRFFSARRFNNLMSGITNQVWAIEQGEESGLHLHVVLFYSADSNHDEYIAKQIGEYWEHVVTEGTGDYWNSNDRKLKNWYAEKGHGIGVGQVNWNDAAKRDALRVNLAYLAKAEQYLMCKVTDGIHTFGMGLVPKKARSGRPRTATSS